MEEELGYKEVIVRSKDIKGERYSLDSLNNTDGYTIVDLFEKQAQKTPDNVAVIFDKEQLSYRQLDILSNQLAHYLVSLGVKEESLVPICMERSLEMIVGILGILKAGGAYVPIDPHHPVQRITDTLTETGASLILTQQKIRDKVTGFKDQLLVLEWEEIKEIVRSQPKERTITNLKADHLAYVIFTSGSTGKPKGILIEHKQLVSSTLARNAYYKDLSPTLLIPSFAFDASVGPIFGSLTKGDCLIVSSLEALQDTQQLPGLLEKSKTIISVPSYYKFLLDEDLIANSAVNTVIVGGESLGQELVNAHFKLGKNIALYNEYGPTETTVWATVSKIESIEAPISIGSPIANAQAYILAESGSLLAEGEVGELHIGGKGLARGYLNNPTLTQEKFVDNPFGYPGSKMYKTGDLCYWLPNKKIAYVGRLDEQVKISGHRIELGEIEAAIRNSGSVKETVVIAKELENGEKQLIAYVVPNNIFDQDDIVKYLKERLPAFMVPTLWRKLEKLPYTPNGKIDKQALREVDLNYQLNPNVEGPRDQLEQSLALMWQKLLHVSRVGIHDDFFALGGNSLLAMRAVASIRKELSIKVSLKDIFDFPTVAHLADHLRSTQPSLPDPVLNISPRPSLTPLSFGQESLWFLDQLEGSVSYHLPLVFDIQGELDKDVIAASLKKIVERHEVLRTVLIEKDGGKMQYVLGVDNWELSLINKESELKQETVLELLQKPFDLSADYPFRAALIRIDQEEHLLVLIFHHIVFDAWSASIFIKELFLLYKAYTEGIPPALKPIPVQYADYAIWQREQFRKNLAVQKIEYWKNKLKGWTPLQLPTDFPRPASPTTQGAGTQFVLEQWITDEIRELSQNQGASLYMTLLAAFKILLYRYSSQEDICVGTTMAGRQQAETENLIGYFVNTLALRSRVNPNGSFLDLLDHTKTNVLEAFENEDIPFDQVVAEAGIKRERHQNPLFQVMFLFQDTELTSLTWDGTTFTQIEAPQPTSKFDITFSITQTSEGLTGNIEYRTELYRSETMERMKGHYTNLLRSLAEDPHQCIGKIDFLSPEEKHRLLVEFNNTKVVYPQGKTIVDLMEEQVLKTPSDTAFIFEDQKLTFSDLDKKANQLAHLLREKGVREETLVLICLERSLEMIVGILGILKAGGAYIPVDPAYPQERIRFIQEDTRATIAVSSRTSQSKLQQLESLDIINLEMDGRILEEKSTDKVPTSIQPQNLAYIIYTSGSTGTPKGVMIEHRNVYSFICWCKDEFQSSHFNIVYAATSICFDLSIFEIFYPLTSGKPARILENGLQIGETLHRDVSVMINTVPGVVQNLLNERADLTNVSLINMAGEPVPLKVLKELDTEKIETRNLYGPSEDTTYSTVYLFDKEKHLLIGKPISNSTIYILNSQNQLCPEGIPGEIFIGGSGLARGYLNREDLTAERFVVDPFSAEADARMYKTGDFGRWVQNGQIEYLGRNDDQVKIRGFRIELGEIERVLQQCEGVQQAVVLAQDDHQNNKQLIGYVVPKDIFDRKSIVSFLRHKLPSYMIPSVWVNLTAFPLTPNGKINKKELPKPDIFGSLEKEHVPPQTKTEHDLAEIWKKLLNIERVGTEDNFFELGGHSLLAISLVMAIRKHFEVDLEIKDLFDFPTIAGLAAKLQWKLKVQSLPAIQKVSPRPNTIPLSYSQESLWFIDQLEGSIQYHVPIILEIEGLLDQKALTQALNKVVERHEILRTVIHHQGGNPAQYVIDYKSWDLSVIQRDTEAKGSKTQQLLAEIINQPFDLAKDFLFRASLIRFDAQQHLLVLVLHHIAADGWSLPILIDEIGSFYRAFQKETDPEVLPLPIQFADFALWQRSHINEDYLHSKANYWRTKLQDLPSLELPTDYPRPETPSLQGTTKDFLVDRLLLDQLILTSKRQGTTLFMMLLATCKVLLHRYSRQDDICLGTATAGRQRPETQNLIGYFINPLPLRTIVDKKASFDDFLIQVKNTCLEAFENQDMPFEKIVTSVGAERQIGKNPLFQVMFILQNVPMIRNLDFGSAKISHKNQSSNTSKLDLTFSITETERGLEGTVEYATDLFKAETISHLIEGYVELLRIVAFNPFIKIEDIDLSSAEIVGLSGPLDSLPKKKKGRSLKESVQTEKHLEHVPARTPEERLVAKIWGQCLGIKKVNIVDNFFEIGGHSLIAVQVMTRLEKESGVKLPLSILFKYPTVQKLAFILKSKEHEVNKWNCLVPIKPLGSKTPLYIIHGAGLNVLPFYSIANNMDPEQPVYGLQAKGLNGIDDPLTSVEAMASHYIHEISNHNPKGPYALAGYSFGGILAFEMAKQLKASGKEVKELILFDTYVYDSDHKKSWLVKFTNKILYSVGKRVNDIKLLINHPDIFKSVKIKSLQRKKNNFLMFLNLKERPQEPEILKIIKKIDGINKEASKNYIFTKYDDEMFLLRAKIKTNYIKDPIYLGWKPYVDKVNIIEVEGKHTTMFSPPHAARFAQVLQDILDGKKNL